MNVYEYQAKKIFKDFGVSVPRGLVAYTPHEAYTVATQVSEYGPWVVKAQIKAGSRDIGKFSDKRAGKKGGIRLSKTLDEIYENADEMLGNMLITNQTDDKGRFVSRVYIEEYIKTIKKFYLSLVVDRISASIILLLAHISQNDEGDVISLASHNADDVLKVDLGLQKEINTEQLMQVAEFINFDGHKSVLKSFLNKILKVFYNYDATLLEVNPIGIDKQNNIWALDAKIVFDSNALYRHTDI